MVCGEPKCFRPKTGKCMKPNPWIVYIMARSAYNKEDESGKEFPAYDNWKKEKFPAYHDNTKEDNRRRRTSKMCQSIVPKLPRQARRTRTGSGNARPSNADRNARLKKTNLALIAEFDEYERLKNRAARKDRSRSADSQKRKASADREHAEKRRLSAARERSAERKRADKIRKHFVRGVVVGTVYKNKKIRASARLEQQRRAQSAETRRMHEADTSSARIRSADRKKRALSAEKKANEKAERFWASKEKETGAKDKIETRLTRYIRRKRFALQVARRKARLESDIATIKSKSAGFYETCTINREHLQLVKKTFNGMKNIAPRVSVCDHLTKFYDLPEGCTLNKYIAGGTKLTSYLVYSGVYRRAHVYIKVATLGPNERQKQGGMIMTDPRHFDYVIGLYDDIPEAVGASIRVPKLLGLGKTTNGKLGFEITSSLGGETLLRQMNKSATLVHNLMTKLGVTFAKLHKKGCHGDAHFENVVVTSAGKLALLDIENVIIFDKTKLTPQEKTNCLYYDMLQIMVSILSEGKDTEDHISYRIKDYKKSKECTSFIEAYMFQAHKNLDKYEYSKKKKVMYKFFDMHFKNKTLGEIHASRDDFLNEKFWPIVERTFETRKQPGSRSRSASPKKKSRSASPKKKSKRSSPARKSPSPLKTRVRNKPARFL